MYTYARTWLLLLVACQLFVQLDAADWTMPENISSSTSVLDQARIASDEAGNAIAIYVQGDETTNVVTASRFSAATSLWETPVALSDSNSFLPQIAVSSAGNAVAVWQRSDEMTGYQKVEYAAYCNGSWTAAAQIDAGHPDDENEFMPSISIDDTGHAFAAWQAGGDPGNVIRAGRYDFASDEWSGIQDLSSIGVNTRERAMVSSNSTGQTIAVWEIRDAVNNEFRIESSQYVSGTWQEVETVATSSSMHQLNPDVAIDNVGYAFVIWAAWDPSTYTFTINAAHRTASWNSPEILSDQGYIVSGDLAKIAHIRPDNSGDAVALWELVRAIDSTSFVQTKVFQQGQWSSSVITLSDPCNLSFNSQLTVNSSGDAAAIWATLLPSSIAGIYVSSYKKDANMWTLSQVLSSVDASTERPNIISNDRGDFFAIWFKLSDSSGILEVSRSSNEYPVLPPESISGQQIVNYYVVATDRVNIINWQASLSTDIGAYLVFRDETLIAILANSELRFEDHNRTENVTYTYDIKAMNFNGLQSSAVTIAIP